MRKLLILLGVVFVLTGCGNNSSNVVTHKPVTVTNANENNPSIQITQPKQGLYEKMLNLKHLVVQEKKNINDIRQRAAEILYHKVGNPPQPANSENDKWRKWIGEYHALQKKLSKKYPYYNTLISNDGVLYDLNICYSDVFGIPQHKPYISEALKQSWESTYKRCNNVLKEVNFFKEKLNTELKEIENGLE